MTTDRGSAFPRLRVSSRWILPVVLGFFVLQNRPAAQDQARPVFRTGTSLVSVDVVVRDTAGAVIRGLTAADFTILEDGRPQQIETFTFQEIASNLRPAREPGAVLAGVEERLREEVQRV